MPEVANPDSSPGTTHRFLSVKEVSNRLHGIWPTLPKSNYYCPLNFKDSKNVWLER